jgi:hypothetical protein
VGSNADAPRAATVRAYGRFETGFVTWLLVAFLVWIPLQTPVAVVAWQYLHVSNSVAQAILLIKDAWAAIFIVALFFRHLREIRFYWFDSFALAFGILIAAYSIVPAALGSHLPALAVISSARELLVPIELYALGRLAGYAGVSTVGLVRAFLVIAGVAATFSVGTFLLLPQTFWNTQYNLVGFIHDVQEVSTATTLWWASLVNFYGPNISSLRAVGPFTHPVGTGVYFALPMTLMLCAAFLSDMRHKLALGVVALGVILFGLAILTPISRGTWLGFLGATVLCGLILHRYRLAALTVVVFAMIIILVPPYSYSIKTAVNGTDSSTAGHTQAVEHAIQVVQANPGGAGVGQGDSLGTIFSGGESAGVGEDMYLSTYTSVGPLGLLAFLIWLAALVVELFGRARKGIPTWISVGVGACLVAEAAAALTASTLMRFTTAASIWFFVGLVMASPAAGDRWFITAARHPRKWLASRGRTAGGESLTPAD